MKSLRESITCLMMCGIACLCASCGPASRPSVSDTPTSVDRTLVERCASIYLLPAEIQTLTIEVDTVEGCEPDQAVLDDLGEFLKHYTSKDVVFVRKASIPRSTAAGVRPEVLAMRNIQGLPDGQSGAGQAFLYMLFYDGGGGPQAKAYVPGDYRCAIYSDMSGPHEMMSWVLRHEAGHVLGLCRNLEHGDGVHCRNKNCVMQARPVISWSVSKFLVGADPTTLPPKDFCDDCQRDLAAMKGQQSPSGMEFRGPFLVRHEGQYTVAMLLCHYQLDFGTEDIPWELLLKIARSQSTAIQNGEGLSYSYGYRCNNASEFQSLLPKIRAAQKDPNPVISSLARDIEKTLEAKYGVTTQAETGPSR